MVAALSSCCFYCKGCVKGVSGFQILLDEVVSRMR